MKKYAVRDIAAAGKVANREKKEGFMRKMERKKKKGLLCFLTPTQNPKIGRRRCEFWRIKVMAY